MSLTNKHDQWLLEKKDDKNGISWNFPSEGQARWVHLELPGSGRLGYSSSTNSLYRLFVVDVCAHSYNSIHLAFICGCLVLPMSLKDDVYIFWFCTDVSRDLKHGDFIMLLLMTRYLLTRLINTLYILRHKYLHCQWFSNFMGHIRVVH